MSTKLTCINEIVHFLPEDGIEAKRYFVEDFLSLPTEGWFLLYGCNMEEFFHINAQHEQNGIAQHILVDYLQSSGNKALNLIREYIPQIKNGSFTVTTAGVGSTRTRQIFHFKTAIKRTLDGKGFICWDGSVNVSESGWLQGNIARVFQSAEYAERLIQEYEDHRKWARENEPQYQVSALSGDPITTYFASLAKYDVLDELREGLEKLDLMNVNENTVAKFSESFSNSIMNFINDTKEEVSSKSLELVKDLVLQGSAWLASIESTIIALPPEAQ